jgi:hypothetical protein
MPILAAKLTRVLVVARSFVDEFSSAYYANRGGAIVDLQGNTIGSCTPAPLQNFDCKIRVRHDYGQRKLDCKSAFTAADFKQP